MSFKLESHGLKLSSWHLGDSSWVGEASHRHLDTLHVIQTWISRIQSQGNEVCANVRFDNVRCVLMWGVCQCLQHWRPRLLIPLILWQISSRTLCHHDVNITNSITRKPVVFPHLGPCHTIRGPINFLKNCIHELNHKEMSFTDRKEQPPHLWDSDSDDTHSNLNVKDGLGLLGWYPQ